MFLCLIVVQLFELVVRLIYHMHTLITTLQIIGSLVQIQDEVSFIENEAQDGGALYINSFGQIRIFPNTTLLFERNKGQ